jgi:hypothetical protein
MSEMKVKDLKDESARKAEMHSTFEELFADGVPTGLLVYAMYDENIRVASVGSALDVHVLSKEGAKETEKMLAEAGFVFYPMPAEQPDDTKH